MRLVADFRHLNNHLRNLKFAYPELKYILQKIGKNKSTIYSVLDIKNAFYSILLHEESRKYTGICASPGEQTYLYTRLPMGTKLSPLIFSNIMTELVANQISLKEYLSFYNHSPIFRDIMYKNYNQQKEFSKFYLPNTKNTDPLQLFMIFTGNKQPTNALQIDLMDLLHFVHDTKIKDTHVCNLIPYNYQHNSSLIPATFYAIKTLRSESIHYELKNKLPLPKIGTPHPKDFQTYEQYYLHLYFQSVTLSR